MTAVTREDFSCAAATNESAYRRVTVPVLRIDAGPGPAVALMAGVHGDEWEGQAAILELWHQLPGILNRGTVYLLPAANAEASLAGRRLSPNDGGNLNRAFLGPRAQLHRKRGGRAGSEAAAARRDAGGRAQRRRIAALPAVLGDHALWPGRARSAPAGAGTRLRPASLHLLSWHGSRLHAGRRQPSRRAETERGNRRRRRDRPGAGRSLPRRPARLPA